jgi:hypothetical protein
MHDVPVPRYSNSHKYYSVFTYSGVDARRWEIVPKVYAWWQGVSGPTSVQSNAAVRLDNVNLEFRI